MVVEINEFSVPKLHEGDIIADIFYGIGDIFGGISIMRDALYIIGNFPYLILIMALVGTLFFFVAFMRGYKELPWIISTGILLFLFFLFLMAIILEPILASQIKDNLVAGIMAIVFSSLLGSLFLIFAVPIIIGIVAGSMGGKMG